jgi:hypothetical protein
VDTNQGDQIGRFFAQWAIGYFGQFLENSEVGHNFWLRFSKYLHIDFTLIVTKTGFGYILGDFFSQTNLVTLVPAKQIAGFSDFVFFNSFFSFWQHLLRQSSRSH